MPRVWQVLLGEGFNMTWSKGKNCKKTILSRDYLKDKWFLSDREEKGRLSAAGRSMDRSERI